jgi:hypothetical protein
MDIRNNINQAPLEARRRARHTVKPAEQTTWLKDKSTPCIRTPAEVFGAFRLDYQCKSIYSQYRNEIQLEAIEYATIYYDCVLT